MSRSFDDELRSLHECFSPSVVRLAVYKGNSRVPVNLGTGIILGDVSLTGLGKRPRTAQSNCIFVLTTMACHEKGAEQSECRVVAKVDDSNELSALPFKKFAIFTVLVIMRIPDEYMDKIIALDDASFHKGKIHNMEPVVVVGCFSNLLKEIAPPGYVSMSDINMKLGMDKGGQPSCAFTHSCPIGDGLIGAPVINQRWKIIGINVACSHESSKVNYALKLEDLHSVLAQILEEDPKKSMSSLLGILRVQFFEFIRCSGAKKTGGASSSSATAK